LLKFISLYIKMNIKKLSESVLIFVVCVLLITIILNFIKKYYGSSGLMEAILVFDILGSSAIL